MSEVNSEISSTTIKPTKLGKIKQKKKINKEKNYFLESKTLRSGFGKMIESKYKTNPFYSLGKERKFFSTVKDSETPGPDYNVKYSYLKAFCKNQPNYSFGKAKRGFFSKYNYNPGPGNYNISSFFNPSIRRPNSVSKFNRDRSKRFKVDDIFMNNLFLQMSYI